jgi:hypothetical protein
MIRMWSSTGSGCLCGERKLTPLRAVRTLRFVRAIQATRCIPGFCGLSRLAEMLESTEGRHADGGIWEKPVTHDVYIAAARVFNQRLISCW